MLFHVFNLTVVITAPKSTIVKINKIVMVLVQDFRLFLLLFLGCLCFCIKIPAKKYFFNKRNLNYKLLKLMIGQLNTKTVFKMQKLYN